MFLRFHVFHSGTIRHATNWTSSYTGVTRQISTTATGSFTVQGVQFAFATHQLSYVVRLCRGTLLPARCLRLLHIFLTSLGTSTRWHTAQALNFPFIVRRTRTAHGEQLGYVVRDFSSATRLDVSSVNVNSATGCRISYGVHGIQATQRMVHANVL